MQPETIGVARRLRRTCRHRLPVALVLLAAATTTACGSRLPDDVLAHIDAATIGSEAGSGMSAAAGPATDDASSSASSAASSNGTVDGAGPSADDTSGGGAASPSAVTGGGGAPVAITDGGGSAAPTTGSDETCRGGASDTGVTAGEVKVASIVTASGPLPGATEGAYRGAAAYLAKVNAEGGVCGRKITLLKGDDGLDPQRARGEFLRLEPQVLAFVGSFAVADSGYIDLIDKTGVPYVGTSVDPAGRELPNVVPHAQSGVAHSGPYVYYKTAHPDVSKVGFMFADVGGVRANVPGIVKGWETAGFDIVYNSGASATQPDFTPDVIKLRQAGTQLLYLFAFEVNMHVRLARNMRQQNWEPEVKVSNIGYNSKLIELLGDTANGWSNHLTYLPVLNEDEPARSPALADFLTWNERVAPGASIDLFPVTAWGDAARFVTALRQAGPEPTREKIVQIVDNLPKSDGGGIFAPTSPAKRTGASCFVIVRVENGHWVREHPDSGFECGMGDWYTF